jgi:hypothetical protein
MRISSILISGAVAAVAVAGSANAAVVDPFTALPSGTAYSNGYRALTGGLTAYSGNSTTNISNITMSGGTMTQAWTTGNTRTSWNYSNNPDLLGAPYIDLSGTGAYFSIDVSNAGGVAGWMMTFTMYDPDGVATIRRLGGTGGSSGTYTALSNGSNTLSLANADPAIGSLAWDWSKVATIQVTYRRTASGTTSFSNFNFVPAPGAIALLGAAGLVGSRRRR